MLRPDAFSILLVEDNPGDVRLAREALREDLPRDGLAVAGDGSEALAYLRREGPHGAAAAPALILLDLNLPRMDGRELLAAIKADARLKAIPVVVLSSSGAPQDIERAYALHANCFVTKPADLDGFVAAVRAVVHFWRSVARLPVEAAR